MAEAIAVLVDSTHQEGSHEVGAHRGARDGHYKELRVVVHMSVRWAAKTGKGIPDHGAPEQVGSGVQAIRRVAERAVSGWVPHALAPRPGGPAVVAQQNECIGDPRGQLGGQCLEVACPEVCKPAGSAIFGELKLVAKVGQDFVVDGQQGQGANHGGASMKEGHFEEVIAGPLKLLLGAALTILSVARAFRVIGLLGLCPELPKDGLRGDLTAVGEQLNFRQNEV